MSDPPAITVVTCLRDEGPFLVEWLAHLRVAGVTRVLAYTNDCRDGTEALLDALAPAGVIHEAQGDIRDAAGRSPQWRAMASAWRHPAVAEADWLLHIDPDEFLAFDGPEDLRGLIDGMPDADAIALPWRLFGCGGRLQAGTGTTPERFSRAAPPAVVFPALASFFKTLFRRAGPFEGFGIHRPRQTAVPVFMDDTGRRDETLAAQEKRILLWRDGAVPRGRRVQLNHYSTRSIHEFLVKRGRGLPNHVGKPIDLEYWVERNFNEVSCDMIRPQLARMNAEVERLRADPRVARAEAACRDWHAAELARILSTPEGARLCGRLVLAAGSRVPPAMLGRTLLAQMGQAQEDAR